MSDHRDVTEELIAPGSTNDVLDFRVENVKFSVLHKNQCKLQQCVTHYT